MQSHCCSHNLQYHSQSIEQNNVSKLSWSRVANITHFLWECSYHHEESGKGMQCHWLSFAIVFHMMTSHATKDHIHPVYFALACGEALKRRNIYCLGTCCSVYKQTERECYSPSVINPIKFDGALFQILIVCYQHSVVQWVMSDKLCKHQCCLLSLNRSDLVWSSVALLTAWPWETGLTSLLTMIDQLTCYSSYNTYTIGSFIKIKLSHVTHFL